MAEDASNYVLGNEHHILEQMLCDEPMMPGSEGDSPGDVIGPYMITELLGEGGFGIVWHAEQTRPIRRDVALKLLRRGMDSAQVLERFRLERQALATMEHPHIAALLDAGSSPDGRPYFVMELVRGKSVTRWCQDQDLPLRERVKLFILVCGGVQHAHQKGVIHRDLKPSNILVSETAGAPIPKIIDFGIAKAVRDHYADQPLVTRQGQVMGTPLYMSPEQLSGDSDVDTRSDIYSLGVLLYEMLTGGLPYDTKQIHESNHLEMRRLIEQRQPVRPSVRLTETLRARKTSITLNAQPQHPLAGTADIPPDLDWIILKTLEKDRERRYESVATLAADVQRYLDNEPVLARPPSFRYIAGRWVRRHRVAFAAACISLLAIIAGAAVALWQAHEARLAQAQAEAESSRAQQAVSFLTSMLDRVAEEIGHGRNPEALKLALEGSEQQIRQMENDPALKADLLKRVGWLYATMGERKLALPLIKAHADLITSIHGPDHVLTQQAELGYLIQTVDHGARMQAPAMIEAAINREESRGHRASDYWFQLQRQLIRAWTKLRQPAKACLLAKAVLAEAKLHPPEIKTLIMLRGSCVDAYQETKDFTTAEALLEESLKLCQDNPELAANRAWIESRVLYIQRAKGDYVRGADILKERVSRLKAIAGDRHPDLIELLLNLAGFERDAKRYDDAISHAREASVIAREMAPSAEVLKSKSSIKTLRSDLLESLRILAECESLAGRHQDAMRDAREAYRVADAQGNNTDIGETLLTLGELQQRAGELEAAYETYELRYQRSGQHGANYQRWHEDLRSMCTIRLKQGRRVEAMKLAEELWQKEKSSPEANADHSHLRDVARLALQCQEALIKESPNLPPSANLIEWKAVIAKAK